MTQVMKLIGLLLVAATLGQAQSNSPKKPIKSNEAVELTGNLRFDVGTRSGAVTTMAVTIGDGGNGPYKAIMAGDSSLTTHTLYRPATLDPIGEKLKLPIVLWANGGCRNSSGEYRNFLSNIASYGYLVIAIGPVKNALLSGSELEGLNTDATLLTKAMDWAIAQNSRPESPYFNRLATNKIAVMGQSCGGLQALQVINDPRVTTTVIWNSGVFNTPPVIPTGAAETSTAPAKTTPRLPTVVKSDLQKLHAPIAYFVGGDSDIATQNATDDFARITAVPALLASYDFSQKVAETGNKGYGHYPATYRDANGGDFAVAGIAWLQWQLKGDKNAAKTYQGVNCGLCSDKKWSVQKKNIE